MFGLFLSTFGSFFDLWRGPVGGSYLVTSSMLSKPFRFVHLIFSAVVIACYVQFSFMSFASLGVDIRSLYTNSSPAYSALFSPQQYSRLQTLSSNRLVQLLHLSSSYGLFRRMTGMGSPGDHQRGVGGAPPSVVARPEIFIEGLDGGNEWRPIGFQYKPGDMFAAPRTIIPHQPRLDWQMWFAALGSYHHNAWLVSFLFKLLSGHCPEVIALLDHEQYYRWFPSPPVAIRVTVLDMDFTRMNTSWSRGLYPTARGHAAVLHDSSDAWWYHIPHSARSYFPISIDKTNPSVHQFLQANGLPVHLDAKTHYKSASSLQEECHSSASLFASLMDSKIGMEWLPSLLRRSLISLSVWSRSLICDAIAIRKYLLRT